MSRRRDASGALSPEGRLGRIDSALDRFDSLRVLVVGDLLLDEYRLGDVDRVSPEAPVPIVRIRSERTALGGAGNVVRGLVALGARASLVAPVGRDREGERAIELLGELGVSSSGLLSTPGRATPHKLRVVARGQQMLRLDREQDAPLSPDQDQALRERIESRLSEVDAVILADYDKGVFGDGLAAWLIGRARARRVPVSVDPKRRLERFRGATLVKPNLAEACAFVPGVADDLAGRRALLEKIQRRMAGAELVLTRGPEGMSALDAAGEMTDVPTRAVEVFDVQGAGDTSIAALALARAAGAELVDACIVANAAAAVAVGKAGTAAVAPDELRRALPKVLAAFEEGT